MLGGTKSGKSVLAEEMFVGVDDVVYVATAEIDTADLEFYGRIQGHQERRPATWSTWEGRSFSEISATIATEPHPILVDSLGSLTTSALMAGLSLGEFGALVGEFCIAVSHRVSPTVLVSEEVGLTVHPQSELGRRYVEFQGIFNQRVSQVVDACYLVVAHRTLTLKSSQPHELWGHTDVE